MFQVASNSLHSILCHSRHNSVLDELHNLHFLIAFWHTVYLHHLMSPPHDEQKLLNYLGRLLIDVEYINLCVLSYPNNIFFALRYMYIRLLYIYIKEVFCWWQRFRSQIPRLKQSSTISQHPRYRRSSIHIPI